MYNLQLMNPHGLLHTAAAGSLANLEVILLQKSSSPLLVDISSPLLSNQVPPQISKWLWLISSIQEQKSQLKSLYRVSHKSVYTYFHLLFSQVKLIQSVKTWGVLENSQYFLTDGQKNFKNRFRNG